MQFTIAPDGTVAQAHVATGSGQAKLDDLIKAMIERIRFPAPPSRASEKQRTFIVPFRMR
jgi:TonB family protein